VQIATGADNTLIEDTEAQVPGDTIGAIHNYLSDPAEALPSVRTTSAPAGSDWAP
jgi:hypothetical protein